MSSPIEDDGFVDVCFVLKHKNNIYDVLFLFFFLISIHFRL